MKKAVTLFFISISAILFSCEPEQDKVPEDIIPKEKFKQMAIDFHLLEAYVEEEYGNSDSSLTIFKKLQEELYVKNNATNKQYVTSYNYYLKNTKKDMDMMYEEIVNELTKLETRTKSKEKEKKEEVRDSRESK